jgi:subtilisin family serine protease
MTPESNGLEVIAILLVWTTSVRQRRNPKAICATCARTSVHNLKNDLYPQRFLCWRDVGFHNVGQSCGTPDAEIDAPEAWNHTTGSSDVIIAVIDSGVVYNHSDFSPNMFRNTADCNNNGIDDDGNGYVDDCYGIDTHNSEPNPMDDNNHGAHVVGTTGAVGNNNAA